MVKVFSVSSSPVSATAAEEKLSFLGGICNFVLLKWKESLDFFG